MTGAEDRVEQGIYQSVTRAFEWLYDEGRGRGNWKRVDHTALVALCLLAREPKNSPWIKEVRSWILAQESDNDERMASWDENVYDTSIALMALLRMGMLNSDPAIGKAMRFLGNCYTANKRPNWEDEPWETSWAILAICESGSSELMDEACDGMRWLMNMQDQRGALVAPHYTAYYVKIVEVLCKKQACRGYCLLNEKEIKETAKKGAAHLMTIVEGEQLWTGEPWSNGQILWALCSSGQFPVEDAASVEMVLDWFQAAQEPKGNWGDAEDTACAIIGLLALLKQRMMDRSEERLKVEDADTIVYNHLRRLYEPPRPCPERKLVQVQEDGTTTINLSSRTLKVAAILFGLASGFTVVLALWEYFKSYLGFG